MPAADLRSVVPDPVARHPSAPNPRLRGRTAGRSGSERPWRPRPSPSPAAHPMRPMSLEPMPAGRGGGAGAGAGGGGAYYVRGVQACRWEVVEQHHEWDLR